MIATSAKNLPALKPRLRLGGLVKDWTPPAPVVAEIPAGRMAFAEARQELVGKFRVGSPVSVDVNERIAGQAVSFTIGSFDLSAFGGAFDAPLPLGASDYSSDASSLKNGMPQNDLLMRLAAVLQPPLAAFVTQNGVLEWPAPLLNYQRDGIAALLARPELLLADDMGLGKTIQAIAALRILFFRREISNALVVCPASLMRQWQRELKKWAPELIVVALAAQAGERGGLWRIPAHIRLISYETLRIDVMEVRDSPAVRQAWGRGGFGRSEPHQKPGIGHCDGLQKTAAQTPLGPDRHPAGKPD